MASTSSVGTGSTGDPLREPSRGRNPATGIASRSLSSPAPSARRRRRVITSGDSNRPPAAIALSVSKSSGPTVHKDARALGTMSGQTHPHAISFTFKVRFMGKNYACAFTLPTLKPTSRLNPKEREEFERAAETHRDLFLKDLEAKAKGTIRGGQDFKVLFTNEGYTAYIPSSNTELNFDPERQSLQEAKKQGYFKTYVDSEDDIGRELSQAISSGSGAKILERLQESEVLAPLRGPEKSEPSTPVGLIRDKQQCYFNSAFLLWATNPAIRDELLQNPRYLKDGTSNPLYVALKGYQKSRKEKKPFNLSGLIRDLRFNPSQQGDVDEVLKAFVKQLDYSQILENSPLYSQIQSLSFCKSPEDSEETVVPMYEEQSLASRTIEVQSGGNLQQMLIDNCAKTARVDGALLASAQGKPLVARSEQFISAPGVLSVCTKRQAAEPIDVDLTMTLPESVVGEETEYELTGFSVHGNGHYVTYIREGGSFYEINDETVRSLTSKEFLEKAKSAYVYIYNKKTSSSSEVETETQNKQLSQATVEQTKISLESGKLSSLDPKFALVNPTNPAITKFHSEIDPDSIGPRTTAVKSHAASQKWFGKDTFTLSDGTHLLYDLEPDVLQVPAVQGKHAVFHVALPSKPTEKNIKNAVKAVLQEAQDKGQTHIAFPLFTCPKVAPTQVFKWMQKAVVEFALENQRKIKGIQEVKILVAAEKAQPKLKQLFKHSVGAQILTIKEGSSSDKQTKTPDDFDADLAESFSRSQVVIDFDPAIYGLSMDSAIAKLTAALDTTGSKNIELIVPKGTDISGLIWGIKRLDACLKAGLHPARGKVILVEKTPLLQLVVESGAPVPPSQGTQLDSYALFKDDDSPYKKENTEYVFDLRPHANNDSITDEFISIPSAGQTLDALLERLVTDPAPSARKVRIVLPATAELPGQLKQIQASMKPISKAIQKKAEDVKKVQQVLDSHKTQPRPTPSPKQSKSAVRSLWSGGLRGLTARVADWISTG